MMNDVKLEKKAWYYRHPENAQICGAFLAGVSMSFVCPLVGNTNPVMAGLLALAVYQAAYLYLEIHLIKKQ